MSVDEWVVLICVLAGVALNLFVLAVGIYSVFLKTTRKGRRHGR